MRIELLGSGGYHPSERRHTACVLVAEHGLMLDAGTGAFRVHDRLAGVALPGGRLDVVLTHAHLDHIVGLTFLIGLRDANGPVETVVHAAPEKLGAIERHLLAEAVFPIFPVSRFEPLVEELELSRGAALKTFPQDHPGGSLGVRVGAGEESFAYVTDTTAPTAETIRRLEGVDLLLHEAYFDDAQAAFAAETGHCTTSQALETAVKARAGKLVMMHLNPRATEAEERAALADAQRIRPDAEYGRDGQAFTL
ncbi:Ribonuclease BN [Planctomycetes bacterium MalM25]|nr:Ribonuclease BN [Planctomycetes bacterium MalM25]